MQEGAWTEIYAGGWDQNGWSYPQILGMSIELFTVQIHNTDGTSTLSPYASTVGVDVAMPLAVGTGVAVPQSPAPSPTPAFAPVPTATAATPPARDAPLGTSPPVSAVNAPYLVTAEFSITLTSNFTDLAAVAQDAQAAFAAALQVGRPRHRPCNAIACVEGFARGLPPPRSRVAMCAKPARTSQVSPSMVQCQVGASQGSSATPSPGPSPTQPTASSQVTTKLAPYYTVTATPASGRRKLLSREDRPSAGRSLTSSSLAVLILLNVGATSQGQAGTLSADIQGLSLSTGESMEAHACLVLQRSPCTYLQTIHAALAGARALCLTPQPTSSPFPRPQSSRSCPLMACTSAAGRCR